MSFRNQPSVHRSKWSLWIWLSIVETDVGSSWRMRSSDVRYPALLIPVNGVRLRPMSSSTDWTNKVGASPRTKLHATLLNYHCTLPILFLRASFSNWKWNKRIAQSVLNGNFHYGLEAFNSLQKCQAHWHLLRYVPISINSSSIIGWCLCSFTYSRSHPIHA